MYALLCNLFIIRSNIYKKIIISFEFLVINEVVALFEFIRIIYSIKYLISTQIRADKYHLSILPLPIAELSNRRGIKRSGRSSSAYKNCLF